MRLFIGYGLLSIIFYYGIGWITYTMINAGVCAGLAKYKGVSQLRLTRRQEFWLAACSALLSLLIPFVLLSWYARYANPLGAFILGGSSLWGGHRRYREKALAREHWLGDILGYSVGITCVIAFLVARYYGWPDPFVREWEPPFP